MKLPLPPTIELTAFMAAVLIVFMFIVTVSGHFPSEHRKDALKGPVGTAILISSTALVVGTALVGLILAYRTLPWYAAVIGGGAMILIAPYALHTWPDSFVNGRFAPCALAAAAALVTALMIGLLL